MEKNSKKKNQKLKIIKDSNSKGYDIDAFFQNNSSENENTEHNSIPTMNLYQNISSTQLANTGLVPKSIHTNFFIQSASEISKQSNLINSTANFESNENIQYIYYQKKILNDYMISLINNFPNNYNNLSTNIYAPFFKSFQDISYLKKNENEKKDSCSTTSDISTSSSSSSTCSTLFVPSLNSNEISVQIKNDIEGEENNYEELIVNEERENLNNTDSINNSNEESDFINQENMIKNVSIDLDKKISEVSNSPTHYSKKPFKHSIDFILGIKKYQEDNVNLFKRKYEEEILDEPIKNTSPTKKQKSQSQF